MDILIITSSRPMQAEYWRQRIAQTVGSQLSNNALILGIYEDWPNGAGNGLGTLNAFREASRLAKERYGRDLLNEMREGASVAIYHTAGLGKRLSPLTAVEGNNKPAVKLLCDEQGNLTIIDAVIKQSLLLSKYRKGRLSVFWGDQLFLPQYFTDNNPSHISVVCQKRLFPSKELWDAQAWDRYGTIAWDGDGTYSHLDKIDYSLASKWANGGIAVSLGTFSFSADILEALLKEFAPELDNKINKMDVEPHLFMPMTLSEELYLDLMQKRGVSPEKSFNHFLRIQRFLENFGNPQYTVEDIGPNGKWWDFGSLDSYYKSLMAIGKEEPLFKFLINSYQNDGSLIETDNNSLLINCKIKGGIVKNSMLFGVQADYVDLSDSVVLNSCAPAINGKEALIYNAISEVPIDLPQGYVRADLFIPEISQHIVMHTQMNRDGKDDWNKRFLGNLYSYAELEQMTRMLDHEAAEEFRLQILQQVQNRLVALSAAKNILKSST